MYVFKGKLVEGNSILALAYMWTFELAERKN